MNLFLLDCWNYKYLDLHKISIIVMHRIAAMYAADAEFSMCHHCISSLLFKMIYVDYNVDIIMLYNLYRSHILPFWQTVVTSRRPLDNSSGGPLLGQVVRLHHHQAGFDVVGLYKSIFQSIWLASLCS